MNKTFCDRCGDEINEGKDHYFDGNVFENAPARHAKKTRLSGRRYAGFHFCKECWDTIATAGGFEPEWEKD